MQIKIDIKNRDFTTTKGGDRLIKFIKNKYEELFYIAKNNNDNNQINKVLAQMQILDSIILTMKEGEDNAE
ncbi:hypothetical protein AB9T38_05915 [Campylobacter hepaticus]